MLRNILRAAPNLTSRVCFKKLPGHAWIFKNSEMPDNLGKVRLVHVTTALTVSSVKQKGSSGLTYARLKGYKRWNSGTVPVALGAGLMAFSLFGKKDDPAEEEDKLITTIKWAKLHAHKGELQKSDTKYHEALLMVQTRAQNGEWDRAKAVQAQTYLYDSMANLALQSMQLQKAESLFKETMVGLLEQGRQKTDNAIIEISLKLAVIYGMMEKHSEAETGYKFCIKALEDKISKKDGESDSTELNEDTVGLLGMTLNSYARYMIVQKKFDEALENLEQSIEIAKNVLGPEHHQLSVLYSDAATINSMKGDHTTAKSYINKAVELGKKTESPDLPMFICNQGVVELSLGHENEAKKLCSDAFKMAKQLDDKLTMKEAQVCLENVTKKEKSKAD